MASMFERFQIVFLTGLTERLQSFLAPRLRFNYRFCFTSCWTYKNTQTWGLTRSKLAPAGRTALRLNRSETQALSNWRSRVNLKAIGQGGGGCAAGLVVDHRFFFFFFPLSSSVFPPGGKGRWSGSGKGRTCNGPRARGRMLL